MNHTVLILDDSVTVRMDLHDAFTAGGFATILCATAEQARTAFAERAFAAAVLDVVLPDADGAALLRELRELPGGEDLVVVLLSSEAEVTDRLSRPAAENKMPPAD